MHSLREQLNRLGWRQGSILDASAVEAAAGTETEAYLVLNQTCDLLHDSLSTEPFVELLPLKQIPTPQPEFAGGRNSRKIHFSARLGAGEVHLEATSTQRFSWDRGKLADLAPSTLWTIPAPVLNDLLVWFTGRYLRTAFPDEFEQRLNPIFKKLKTALERDHELIDTLYLSIDPFDEVDPGDIYELHLLLAVQRKHLDESPSREKLFDLAERIDKIFEKAIGLQLFPVTSVKALDEITLAQLQAYIPWTRYDYLSFGDGE